MSAACHPAGRGAPAGTAPPPPGPPDDFGGALFPQAQGTTTRIARHSRRTIGRPGNREIVVSTQHPPAARPPNVVRIAGIRVGIRKGDLHGPAVRGVPLTIAIDLYSGST